MKIYINKYHKDNVLEKFIDKTVEVYSRSGLNETEKRLINVLPGLKEPQKILVLENRTGVLSMIASDMYPLAKVINLNTDRYYCDKIVHNLKHNEAGKVKVICEPDVTGEYDVILWQQTKANLVKEYVFDLMQQCHQSLKRDGKLFLALEEKEKHITEKMQDMFGGATIDGANDLGLILIGKKKKGEIEYTDYSDDFPFTSLTGEELSFRSLPGVFAHHRVDEGAKAMLEKIEIKDGESFLDMGCGIGSIGISLAKTKKLKTIYFVDSNSRALKATEYNCQKNGIENYQIILSAAGYKAPGKVDVFAGNPPYFSDYRIAELFVETARENLVKGGKAWFVTKNPWKLVDIIRNHFGSCREIRLHGYSLLVAER
ncbi:MAG: methyltransferase [Candidatus Cloacimonetes bacterium]|nr:methyltransferase [Candidatus Cloacimonadota bacterium]